MKTPSIFLKALLLVFVLQVFATNLWAQKYSGNPEDIELILKNIEQFSQYYMNGDYDKLANAYTQDGKILPPNTKIIEGRDAIRKRWVLPEGVEIPHHKITPKEIKIVGDYAYDLGYYEGKSRRPNGDEFPFKGKYVIVWKKVEGDWKIYLDMWNSVED